MSSGHVQGSGVASSNQPGHRFHGGHYPVCTSSASPAWCATGTWCPGSLIPAHCTLSTAHASEGEAPSQGTCPPAMRWHLTLNQALFVPHCEKGRQVAMALAAEPGHFWETGGAVLVPKVFGIQNAVSLSNIMDVGMQLGTILVGDLNPAPRGKDDYFLRWEEVSQEEVSPSFSPPAEDPTALAQGLAVEGDGADWWHWGHKSLLQSCELQGC